MNVTNSPAFLCSLCVSAYWLTVFIKSILITSKIGKAPNIIPREILGLISRFFMVPLIVCWIFFPWQAAFLITPMFVPIAWVGAVACVLALTLSFYCWYYMGTAWRIGIDPKEKNELIMDGPFKRIRHPIYSLSILLMLGSFLSVQTPLMGILFCIHGLIFTLEAYREERYLSKVHGVAYKDYIKQTNRFLP